MIDGIESADDLDKGIVESSSELFALREANLSMIFLVVFSLIPRNEGGEQRNRSPPQDHLYSAGKCAKHFSSCIYYLLPNSGYTPPKYLPV